MTEQEIPFKASSSHTLGVEIEFQIVDRNSYELVPFAPVLYENAPEILKPRLALEFIKPILEIRTGICAHLRDVENDLLQTCSLAEELAADHDCLLHAAGLHPFAQAEAQQLSDGDRYKRIMREVQIVGRRFIAQGLHVHVGLPDGDAAIRAGNHIQAFLPIFLALSTSSPFYQGKDTGLMSYRAMLFDALPLAGVYEYMRDWRHFSEEVTDLQRHHIIESFRDLWWDARPNPEFGTIEIRICDLPTRFRDILAMVALIQSCIAWLGELESKTEPFRFNLLRANKWQAARYGLAGRFVDPSGLLGTEAMDFRRAATLLRERVAPFASQLQGSSYLDGLAGVIADGTGADLQREIYNRTHDFTRTIAGLHQGFWK